MRYFKLRLLSTCTYIYNFLNFNAHALIGKVSFIVIYNAIYMREIGEILCSWMANIFMDVR